MIHVGAGFGGINLAYQVQRFMKDVELVCYEKNKCVVHFRAPCSLANCPCRDIAGTWLENKCVLDLQQLLLYSYFALRYPGCACDIPSHSYQFSWAPTTSWTQ